MEDKRPLQSIPDDELLHRLAQLMSQSRRVEADIVAHIAEVEERRLYAREAFSSMFVYCMDVLHLSEAEAYLRIAVARASRKHPILLTMLADGRLHLTAINELAPHLTHENRDGLLERATHRSKRQIEELIAEIAPRPDVPVVIRRLPERRTLTAGLPAVPGGREGPTLDLGPNTMLGRGPDPMLELGPDRVAAPEPGAPDGVPVNHDASHAPDSIGTTYAAASPSTVSPTVIQPLSPGRYKVQFTASAELRHKLQRLQALMTVKGPDCDLALVIEQAVTEKLERLEARRFVLAKARRKRPVETETESSPSSRYIPATVRRAVRERDGDRCRYVDEQGRRCAETRRLQFHHRHPFGFGGGHNLANIRLMCPAHNAYVADCDYGREAMRRHRRSKARASQATVV